MQSYASGSSYTPHGRAHRFVTVQRITGILLMVFSLTMVPPIAVDLLYERAVLFPFLVGMSVTAVSGVVMWWPARRFHADLKTRDGFLITVIFWTVLGLAGAVPLHLAHQAWPTYTDAVFEAVSGITTTGATTVVSGLDDLPHSLNYYRAQLHWLGGMGVIVLAVAILPILGVGGMQLYRAESPGPLKESKLTPRIAQTARVLWLIYLSLTLLCAACYRLAGMSTFDAICHAFSTVATGGFSTHDASIGHFDSIHIELVAQVFMVLGALNFATHFAAWRERSGGAYWRDGELRMCFAVIATFSALVAIPLITTGTYASPFESIRYAVFQVISYGTTTGFLIADPTPWPLYAPSLLILATFMIGCAGSTAGGVKVVRLMLFLRQAAREIRRLPHPRSLVPITLGGKVVQDSIMYSVGAFFSVYIITTIVLTMAMIATGLSPLIAISSIAASLNNAGPGLGDLASSMASVSESGKWVLIFAMLLGRLEIFTLLIVFTPAFWKR